MKTILQAFVVMVAAMFFGMSASHAAPVRIDYSGSVFGYYSLPIVEDDFPLGTPFSASISFDEDFRSLNVNQLHLGLTRQVWGSMHLGSKVYQFSEMRLTSYGFSNTTSNGVDLYGFHVLGTGPDTDDGEKFGALFISLVPDLPYSNAISAAFGDGSLFVANNGFAMVTSFGSMQAIDHLPEPASGALVLAALLGLALVNGRRGRRARVALANR